jgi:hypothetical protein
MKKRIALLIAPRIQDDFGYTPAGASLVKANRRWHISLFIQFTKGNYSVVDYDQIEKTRYTIVYGRRWPKH